MSKENSVVTVDRFNSGMLYKDFVSQINVNQDRFEQYYETVSGVLIENDVAFFKQMINAGASKVLVLGEDWCPDVYRGMPVMAKIADSSGMDLRVFPRDVNLDIMDEFLKEGEHRSIPVFVFYTEDQDYLCHWIERPVIATKEMAAITESIEKKMPGKDEQEIREARRELVNARFPDWQRYTIDELRELLSQSVKI
jgi:thiol-disulfide isomerase/thioredoxin